jgi:hypothetical protein
MKERQSMIQRKYWFVSVENVLHANSAMILDLTMNLWIHVEYVKKISANIAINSFARRILHPTV